MELPAAEATTCNSKKRKKSGPTTPEQAKRLKPVQRGEEMLESGWNFYTPRISVLFDQLQQPITLNELIELLHYATLGKTGGIKQPR